MQSKAIVWLYLLASMPAIGQLVPPSPRAAAPVVPNRPDASGVIEDFNFASIDDLLKLEALQVHMTIFKTRSEAEVSSAHLEMFKRWVSGGGIAYFAADANLGSLAVKLGIASATCTRVQKESGATFALNDKSGDMVGELFVKGLLETVAIRDHPITADVNSLYAGPVKCTCSEGDVSGVYYFTRINAAIIPVLQLGYLFSPDYLVINKRRQDGAQFEGIQLDAPAVIYGVVELGKGMILLDGTGLMLGANSFRGNTYDWTTLNKNLQSWASKRSSP